MKRSFITTLVLIATFGVLLAWYLIYESSWRPEHDKKKEEAKKLVHVQADSIQEIQIELDRTALKTASNNKKPEDSESKTPAGNEKYRLKKMGSDWMLVEPVEDEADNSTVQSLVTSLTTAQSESTVEEQVKDLEPFGLKKPAIRITARKDSSTPAVQVSLGADTPVGYNAYVQVEGEKSVKLVNRSLKSSFDKTLWALRNKKVVKLSRHEITEVEVRNSKENFILKKDKNDNWLLVRDNIPADSGEWNKTLDAVVNMVANSVVDEQGKSSAKYGLQPPQITVTLTGDKGKKTVVLLAKASNKYFAKRADSPRIYDIVKDVIDKVNRPSNDYRSLVVAKFNRFKVKRIKLERPADPIDLEKKDPDWKLVADPNLKIDTDKVETLLTKLQDMKITRYLPESSPKLASPDLTVRLTEKDGEQLKERLTLKFGKRQNNELVVESSDYSMPFAVNEKDFNDVNMAKQSFIKTETKKEAPKTDPKAQEAKDKKAG